MRTKLKLLRVKLKKTQAEFANALGVTRCYYSAIESGKCDGSLKFWRGLQEVFCIPNSEMWELMSVDD